MNIPGRITPCVRSQETAFNSIMILLPTYYLINLDNQGCKHCWRTASPWQF